MICTSPQANGILNAVPDRILHEDEESSKKKFENHHNSETHNTALKRRLKALKCYDDKLVFFPLLCEKYCSNSSSGSNEVVQYEIPQCGFSIYQLASPGQDELDWGNGGQPEQSCGYTLAEAGEQRSVGWSSVCTCELLSTPLPFTSVTCSFCLCKNVRLRQWEHKKDDF